MFKRIVLFIILGACSAAALVYGPALVRGETGAPVMVETDRFHQAVLIRDAEKSDLTLYLVFPSGEAANPGAEGLAHYVEHLAWLNAFGEVNGADYRDANAWTNQFVTGYWQRAKPAEVAATLQRLMAVADPIELDADFALQERDILQREYETRLAEWPLLQVQRDVTRSLYGNGALSRSVIGDPAGISQFGLDDAYALHRQTHVLPHATLIAFGNLSRKEFARILNSIPPAPTPVSNAFPKQPVLVDPPSGTDTAEVFVPNLAEDLFLFRKLVPFAQCASAAKCELATQLVEEWLNSSLPGGLAGPLRYDRFVARDFGVTLDVLPGGFLELGFWAQPDAGVALNELESAFRDALNIALSEGMEAASFDRLVARFQSGLDATLERDLPSVELDLLLGQINAGKAPYTLAEEEAALDDLGREEVNQVLNAVLSEGRTVTRRIHPQR